MRRLRSLDEHCLHDAHDRPRGRRRGRLHASRRTRSPSRSTSARPTRSASSRTPSTRCSARPQRSLVAYGAMRGRARLADRRGLAQRRDRVRRLAAGRVLLRGGRPRRRARSPHAVTERRAAAPSARCAWSSPPAAPCSRPTRPPPPARAAATATAAAADEARDVAREGVAAAASATDAIQSGRRRFGVGRRRDRGPVGSLGADRRDRHHDHRRSPSRPTCWR